GGSGTKVRVNTTRVASQNAMDSSVSQPRVRSRASMRWVSVVIGRRLLRPPFSETGHRATGSGAGHLLIQPAHQLFPPGADEHHFAVLALRSEERRVGKERRPRWSLI